MTLLELLLVLAVLAVLMALVWPPLDRMYDEHRLRQGVQMVQSQIEAGRLRAIDSTLIYEFRFAEDGQFFVVVPHEQNPNAPANGTTGTAGAAGAGAGSADGLERFGGELNERLRFEMPSQTITSKVASGPSVPLQSWQLAGMVHANDLVGVSWCPPVLLFPDGSSTGGQFVIRDDRDAAIQVSIRDLTGAVTSHRVVEEPRR
jgi:type II secretory pathway pseudopilin PulG